MSRKLRLQGFCQFSVTVQISDEILFLRKNYSKPPLEDELQNCSPFQAGHPRVPQRNQPCQSRGSDTDTPSQERAARPPNSPSHRINWTSLIATGLIAPSTHPNSGFLHELMWRMEVHRALFANFCGGEGGKTKSVLKTSPEVKNKWETPQKRDKKVPVRTTNCLNSCWWRRINAWADLSGSPQTFPFVHAQK